MKTTESNENNAVPTTQNDEQDAQAESANREETPRAMTPLEKVRAGQVKMRGQGGAAARGGQGGGAAASANSPKRPLYQRKAG